MTEREALIAELAEHTAIAARLAAALADTPDDGDGCAYLPKLDADAALDAQGGPTGDDLVTVRAEACAANAAVRGGREVTT